MGRAARAAQGCCPLLIGARDTSPVCNVGSLADEGDRGWDGRFEAVWVQGGMGWGQQAVHWAELWKQKTGERGTGGTQGVVFRQIRELIHSQWDSGTREGLERGRWWEGGRVHSRLAGTKSSPGTSSPRAELYPAPSPPGFTVSALAVLVRATAPPRGCSTPTQPCPGGGWHNPPGAKLPALDGGCFPGCLHQTCSLLVSANRIDRPFATSTNPTAGLGKHIPPTPLQRGRARKPLPAPRR